MRKLLMSMLGAVAPLTAEDDALLLGAKMRRARDRAGLNQAEAAKLIQIRPRRLSALENGEECDEETLGEALHALAILDAQPEQVRLPDKAGRQAPPPAAGAGLSL